MAGIQDKQFLWFNRFSPSASDYPFTLEEVSAIFPDSTSVGNTIEVVVYADTDTNPANGATFLYKENFTIQYADNTTWNVFTLATPVTLNGPSGDVLIGMVNRSGGAGISDAPAAVDTTASQRRSYAADYSTTVVPDPPTLTGSNVSVALIDSQGFAGNWMIRGKGT